MSLDKQKGLANCSEDTDEEFQEKLQNKREEIIHAQIESGEQIKDLLNSVACLLIRIEKQEGA